MSRCYPKRFRTEQDLDPDYIPDSHSSNSSSEYLVGQTESDQETELLPESGSDQETELLPESESDQETELLSESESDKGIELLIQIEQPLNQVQQYVSESQVQMLESEKLIQDEYKKLSESSAENIITDKPQGNDFNDLDVFDAPVQVCNNEIGIETERSERKIGFTKIVLKTKTIIIDEDENVTIEYK